MRNNKQIKCLIWDLDNTIWSGTIAEHDTCRLKKGILPILKRLDRRGILMSIASANDELPVKLQLKKHKIGHYFVHPQINWDNKVRNIQTIASRLDIALSAIGFIDDEPFELAQVQMLLPEVRTYAAEDYLNLQDFPEFNPSFVTAESSRRREMYLRTELRERAEQRSHYNRSEFLQWTRTTLSFRLARPNDFERIMELMNRTSQLNATGHIYRSETVKRFMNDANYHVYIAELRDRFVDYGKIGVAICHLFQNKWRLISFLVSCRVLSRGISGVFLNIVRHEAYKSGVEIFEACYKRRDRNHKMLMLYTLNGLAFAGETNGDLSIYRGPSRERLIAPKWLTVIGNNGNGKMPHSTH